MKKIIYAIMFAGTASLSGGVAYLVAPSQVIQASVSSSTGTSVAEEESEDDWSWAPIELTPAQIFIQNLTDMSSLSFEEGTLNISSSDFELGIENLNLYMSINDITSADIALEASADILYKGHTLPIEFSFVDSTVYLSAVGIDMKATADDIGPLFDMLGSFGVDLGEMDLGSIVGDLDVDSLIAELGAMSYEEEEGGYKYTVNLLGLPLTFYSDANEMMTAIELTEATIENIAISAYLPAAMTLGDCRQVLSPESEERKYQCFNDYINLVTNVSSLVNETRFGLTVNGNFKELSSDKAVSLDAALQFDITEQSGKGLLNLKQSLTDFVPEEDSLQLEIMKEDVKLRFNDAMYAKFNFDTCRDLFETISDILLPEGKDFATWMGETLPTLEGTIVEKVLNGEYEVLLDSSWLHELYVDSSKAELIVSKDLLGTDSDIHVRLTLEGGNIRSLELLDFSAFGYEMSFAITLEEYGFYKDELPGEDVQNYMDITYINNLVENALPLLDQRKFSIDFDGGFHQEGNNGVTFEGNTQFDLDMWMGHGNISIAELDKTYDDTPVHNIRIDIDNEDMRFKYNEGLYGKFTLQTLRDLGEMVGELIDNEDARVYEYIGGLMDKVENIVLADIINGDYYLLFAGMVKDLDTTENSTKLVVSKELLGLDSDIALEITYNENGIAGVSIPEFSVAGYYIHLNASFVEYNENYEWLPMDAKYYDFSDIKVLLRFGIETCDLAYYHLKGKVKIDSIKLGSLNLSGIAGLFMKDDIDLEFEIFDDNGDIKVSGTIDKIPSITGVNYHGHPLCSSVIHDHAKTVRFYYSNKEIYLSRTEYYQSGAFSCKQQTKYTKVSADVFLDEIAYYATDFVLSLKDDIMDDIFSEKSETKKDNTSPDYSRLFKDYSYTHVIGSNDYKWYFDVNLGAILKNDMVEYLKVTATGQNLDGGDGRMRGFLKHLDVSTKINASGFSLGISLSADMLNFDVTITSDKFTSIANFNSLSAYIIQHAGDKPMDYSSYKA